MGRTLTADNTDDADKMQITPQASALHGMLVSGFIIREIRVIRG
jgi:hypothetical protein